MSTTTSTCTTSLPQDFLLAKQATCLLIAHLLKIPAPILSSSSWFPEMVKRKPQNWCSSPLNQLQWTSSHDHIVIWNYICIETIKKFLIQVVENFVTASPNPLQADDRTMIKTNHSSFITWGLSRYHLIGLLLLLQVLSKRAEVV